MQKLLPVVLLLLAGCAASARQSSIGYPSALAALEDLKSKPGVELREEMGWTVATDRAAYTVWSFTPVGHPAHPAAVKRIVTEKDGAVWMDTKVLCQATRAACDQLVEDFKQLNERTRQSMQR